MVLLVLLLLVLSVPCLAVRRIRFPFTISYEVEGLSQTWVFEWQDPDPPELSVAIFCSRFSVIEETSKRNLLDYLKYAIELKQYEDVQPDNLSPFIFTIPWGNAMTIDLAGPMWPELTVRDNVSVVDTMADFCSFMDLSEITCNVLEDKVSTRFYHRMYTPSRPTSTLNDAGYTRLCMVHDIARHYKYDSYLEIGCAGDEVFEPVSKHLFSRAVGVDPESGGTHRMTSDDFFLHNTDYFDLIFIDGLHEANQVFRDMMNALRWLKPGGMILLHDCNPRGPEFTASYPRHNDSLSTIWLGDTWKAIVAMRMNPDVDLFVVDVDMGIAVMRPMPNSRPLSPQWQSYLGVNPISMLRHAHLERHREELLLLSSLRDTWLRLLD